MLEQRRPSFMPNQPPLSAAAPRAHVLTGLEVLARDGHPRLAGLRIGLLVNQASVDRQFRHAAEILTGRDDFTVGALFGPQHGLWGTTQDNMIEWEGGFTDPHFKVPVHSLYGEVRKPRAEWLRGLDAMVCDLVDVGARYYTFVWTLTYVLEACAEAGLPLFVLDRPNPLNGVDIEGPIWRPDFHSFVGRDAIPMRHGMTMGELLLFYNDTHGVGADITVIPASGWKRGMWLDDTDVAWAMPSPNMPTLDTAIVYPGQCLLEATLLSEGRGTTRPFEIFGAPYIDAHAYCDALNSEGLAGCYFRPLYFEPTFQKHARQTCGGCFLHVTDRSVFRSVHATVAILHQARRMYPQQFAWKPPPYEYETIKMPIDILAGDQRLREAIEAGTSPQRLVESWQAELDAFHHRREPYLLYSR